MGYVNSLAFVGLHSSLYLITPVFFNGRIRGSHKLCQAQEISPHGHF